MKNFNQLKGWKIIAGASVLVALPAVAQETCDQYPELSSCNTTPVGVCDAASTAQYVLDKGDNHWVVLPVDGGALGAAPSAGLSF